MRSTQHIIRVKRCKNHRPVEGGSDSHIFHIILIIHLIRHFLQKSFRKKNISLFIRINANCFQFISCCQWHRYWKYIGKSLYFKRDVWIQNKNEKKIIFARIRVPVLLRRPQPRLPFAFRTPFISFADFLIFKNIRAVFVHQMPSASV